jgi:hypothetical protein
MTEDEERKARERDEIAARVAAFRATQEKFQREREEYFVSTLGERPQGGAAIALAIGSCRQTRGHANEKSPEQCSGLFAICGYQWRQW